MPYNPDIANVFYRTGYIEHWGRGIEKICDACKELGEELPVYELRGNGLRIHFKALQSALIDQPKVHKVEAMRKRIWHVQTIHSLTGFDSHLTDWRFSANLN